MVVARMGVWGKGQPSLAPPQHEVIRSAISALNLVQHGPSVIPAERAP
jgi:hypothetical protein